MGIMHSRIWLLLASLAAVFFSSTAVSSDFPTLDSAIDPVLQQAMDKSLQELNLDRAVAEKRLAVSLVDITDAYHPRMAEVNGNVMLYAASLPKIAILFGAMQKTHENLIPLDADLRAKLVRMIRHSSNADASDVLSIVGEEYLAELLQSEDYEFYKPDRGGLWVGKSYGKGQAWQRDPLFNISHGASGREVSRFYYMLATNQLVSPRSSEIMREILSEPAINHKFVSGMQRAHPEARILRKSGTWQTYHSDSAIIERDGKRYIVVALANDPNGGKWLERIVVAMDEIVFSGSPVESIALGRAAVFPDESVTLLR